MTSRKETRVFPNRRWSVRGRGPERDWAIGFTDTVLDDRYGRLGGQRTGILIRAVNDRGVTALSFIRGVQKHQFEDASLLWDQAVEVLAQDVPGDDAGSDPPVARFRMLLTDGHARAAGA
jgi:hypothetical protein